MRILIPTADYPPIEGGISSVTVHVARELARLGHDVTVVAPHFPDTMDFDAAEPVRVKRYRGYALGPLRLLPMLAATWPLARDTDLLLAINVASGGIIGYAAARHFRKPYVVFAYAYEFLKFQNSPLPAALLRAVYAHAKRVIAISGFTRDSLAAFGVDPAKTAVVFPGAPAAHPLAPEALEVLKAHFTVDTPHLIFAVGRFMPRKGHATLLRAMPRILEEFPDALLVMAGQGPMMRSVVPLAYDLGVREHVLFPGRLSDDEVAGLYQACEVFALPTGAGPRGQVEGFGLVFSEAHAYGKPVVAGRSGGVVDAVLDGETGILVEPDDPDATADAILRLMRDPALARRMGEAGRQRVEQELNWETFTRRMLAAAGDIS